MSSISLPWYYILEIMTDTQAPFKKNRIRCQKFWQRREIWVGTKYAWFCLHLVYPGELWRWWSQQRRCDRHQSFWHKAILVEQDIQESLFKEWKHKSISLNLAMHGYKQFDFWRCWKHEERGGWLSSPWVEESFDAPQVLLVKYYSEGGEVEVGRLTISKQYQNYEKCCFSLYSKC